MNRFVKAGLTFAAVGVMAACSPSPTVEPNAELSPVGETNVKVTRMAVVNGYPIDWFCDGQDKILILVQYRGIAAMPNHPDCVAVRAHPSRAAK